MRRAPLTILLISLLPAACALNFQSHEDQVNEVMEQSVGRDINAFIAALGPPQQVMEAPGQEGRIFCLDRRARKDNRGAVHVSIQ
jgi:hypothetical protein